MSQPTLAPIRPALSRISAAFLLAALLTALPWSPPLEAQSDAGASTVERRGPDVWALENARLVIAPGKIVDRGTLVIADGKILAAGASVKVPAGAREISLAGKTLYPGFIDSYMPRGWPEGKLPPQGSSPIPRVHPERDFSLQAFDAALAKAHRRAGFTTALVVPTAGVIRGQSALVNLGDGGLGANLLRSRVAQHFSLEGTRDRVYGRSIMGATALVRQTLLDAERYSRIRSSKAGRRIPFDRSLEALAPALNGTQPSIFEAKDVLASLRAGRMAKEYSLRLWLVGHGHEYKRLREIAALGVPILLPVDFPEAPEVGEEGDDLSVKLEDLRHWDRAPENPGILLDAGLSVAITAFRQSSPKDIFKHLATLRDRGLSEDQLLAALTTTPARLLDLQDQAGTLEAGKMANLLVVDGDLWKESPKILDVWIDGRRYPLHSGERPDQDPTGEWQLTLRLGDGGAPAHIVLRLAGSAEDLSGQVEAGDSILDLSSATLSGSSLEVVYDGARVGTAGSVTLELELDGDKARGKGFGPSGEFDIEGRRIDAEPEAGS